MYGLIGNIHGRADVPQQPLRMLGYTQKNPSAIARKAKRGFR